MPLVFVHGVNTRRTPAYERDVALRRTMFTRSVLGAVRDRTPSLSLAPEVYWGDRGVRFDWSLASVPAISTLESLGPAVDEGAGAVDFAELLDLARPTPATAGGDLERLGAAEDALLTTARAQPQQVVDAIVEAERRRVLRELSTAAADGATAAAEGEQLAELLLAAEAARQRPDLAAAVAGASSDEAVVAAVTDAIAVEYRAPEEPVPVEALGAGDWLAARLADLRNAARAALKIGRDPARGAARVATLLALQAKRDALTRQWAFFLGDAFEYLRRGQAADGIAAAVEEALADAAAGASEADPLVVVTHSFGSAIVYDLLASGRPAGAEVALWVMAGSQVSLFAEMRMFASSPSAPPAGTPAPLGRPAAVRRWANVYDPADVLSYLAEPVFGSDAVEDLELREWGNIATAHSDYFVEPAFYRLVADRIGS